MKFLVISDTHGRIDLASKIISRLRGDIAGVFHLGDMYDDAERLKKIFSDIKFHSVPGNCDYFFSDDPPPGETILDYNGVKLFLAHGHKHIVKYGCDLLASEAKTHGCKAALAGHTHVAFNDYVNGVLIVNPGSLTYPRGRGRRPQYAVLDIDEQGEASAGIVTVTKEYLLELQQGAPL